MATGPTPRPDGLPARETLTDRDGTHPLGHPNRRYLGTRPTEKLLRRVSERTSRRGFIAKGGRLVLALAGAQVLTALPVRRSAAQEQEDANEGPAPGTDATSPTRERFVRDDPTDCYYWRYCNLHGTLCTTCPQGGLTQCPPGTSVAQEFWVGCCENPADGQTYLLAYVDCCGKSVCGQPCGEAYMQVEPYSPAPGSQTNDILWCMSDESQAYTCTLAPIWSEECDVRELR